MNNGQEKSADAHMVDQKKWKKEKENSSPLGSIILAWVVHHVISLSLCVLFFYASSFLPKEFLS
jgi:phosphate/sulfate permease